MVAWLEATLSPKVSWVQGVCQVATAHIWHPRGRCTGNSQEGAIGPPDQGKVSPKSGVCPVSSDCRRPPQDLSEYRLTVDKMGLKKSQELSLRLDGECFSWVPLLVLFYFL